MDRCVSSDRRPTPSHVFLTPPCYPDRRCIMPCCPRPSFIPKSFVPRSQLYPWSRFDQNLTLFSHIAALHRPLLYQAVLAWTLAHPKAHLSPHRVCISIWVLPYFSKRCCTLILRLLVNANVYFRLGRINGIYFNFRLMLERIVLEKF